MDCATEMTEGEERDDLCIVCECVVVRGGDKTKVHKEDGCGAVTAERERRTDAAKAKRGARACNSSFICCQHSL